MAEYQRIVSYLYEYSNGMKGENVGFAKIEKRQKQLRLYFHVKTNDKALTYKIYFYTFRHGTMEGILLDSFQRNDTIIEFKNTYPLVVDLDQVDGFMIYHSNSHFFGSEWNEKPITIRNFLPADETKTQAKTSAAEEIKETEISQEESASELPLSEEPPADDTEVPPETETPVPVITDEPEEDDEEEPPASAPDPPPITVPIEDFPEEIPTPEDTPETEITVPEPIESESPPPVYIEPEIPEPVDSEPAAKDVPPEEASPEQQDHSESKDDDASKLTEYIEALQLEKKAKEQGVPNTPSLFDWKEYPTLPLPPSYMLDPSIKIKVDDLPNIPDIPEDLKTNGFLLLNYGSYGHLMLSQHKQTKMLYLGIPGVFDNEKNFIAKLFGFKDFLTVPETCQKTGNFGYWILAL